MPNNDALTPEMTKQLDSSISASVEWLRKQQHEDGHWVGFLKTNSSIEAEWIIAMYFLGIDNDPKYDGVVKTIISEQREDGSWEAYKNAPAGNISTTVEAYVALRIAGQNPNSKRMTKAREWILANGGLSKVRVFTKIWLALLGEWPWDATPNLPPEIILLPKWFPINVYKFSSWGRATAIAIAQFSCKRPVKRLPENMRLDELFPRGRDKENYSLPFPNTALGQFFWYADRLLNKYVNSPIQPLRKLATKLCIEWILKRQEADGCWAGIQPPWLNAIIGLYCQGYALDHPAVKAGLNAFNEPWAYTNEKGTYLQCCTSPVWDTVLTLQALWDCGLSADDAMVQKAIDYTLREQIRVPGDWSVNAPVTTPGGWAFEYEHDNYPDVDDSAVAVLSLARYAQSSAKHQQIDEAIQRGMNWIEALRSDNGAWGAFDSNNDSEIVAQIPFSDFGEVLDPPSADVTAHVIEAYGYLGRNLSNSTIVRRAVQYLRSEQEEEGCWFGRWGVNYIYGTGWVLPGLKAAGEDMQAEYIQRAAQWLCSKQNEDGGWGETCASYMDTNLRGVGVSTPSQTGWALMGLLSLEDHRYDQAIARGIAYLTSTQKDGTWEQEEYTGTGFPGYGIGARTNLSQKKTLDQGRELERGFMLNYAMYRHYFPMMALGRARRYFGER
ncbi:squalene--hopene cyclase [bacterium]|nr:squalene--hopene cyclase [bacterium]